MCIHLATTGPLAQAQLPQKPANPTPTPTRVTCLVNTHPPSDAEKALSREDYDVALKLFQNLATSSPDVSRAGVIRTLLEQGKVQDAASLANQWKDAQPNSGPAMETWGEVLYRQGQLYDALKTVLASRALDPCNPRALLNAYRVENLSGNHATAAHLISTAHMLAPHDLQVDAAWSTTLPRSQRLALEAAVAKDDQLLNAKDRQKLLDGLAHQKDYSSSDCQVTQPFDHAEIHMEEIMYDPDHRQSFGMNVKFNGHQRTLEIDSGASGIVLSRGAAARLGLIHDQQITASGIGDQGDIQSAIAHVDSIRIGGLEFTHCPVAIFEKNDQLGIDGLIGTDFFKKYLVTLDFPSRKIELSQLPRRPGEAPEAASNTSDDAAPVFHDRYIAPEMKNWTMIWRNGHFLVLPVSIGNATDKLFLIDTGAASMLISPAAAREVTKVHGDSDDHILGVSGEVRHVYQTQQFVVSFAHVRMHVDSMMAIDVSSLSKDAGFEISGLLGAPVLDRLILQIDYRDNLVNLHYDPKLDPQNRPPVPLY
ncbi:MAG: aspartyl protease family protein [Acidobacteriaceae bacterium]